MARRRTSPATVQAKWQLAERLRTIRTELFGDRGLAEFARQLGVPVRTWYSYETGVTVPAEVMLRFIELTSAEPAWLRHGRGPKYQARLVAPGETGGRQQVGEGPPGQPNRPEPTGDAEASPGVSPRPRLREDEPARPGRMNGLHAANPEDTPRTPESAGPWPEDVPLPQPLARRGLRCVRVEGDSMAPILADGAFVAYAEVEGDDPDAFEGKLVIAFVGDRPIVRWFSRSGCFGLLRAENPASEPRTHLIDLEAGDLAGRRLRRVLWVGTAH